MHNFENINFVMIVKKNIFVTKYNFFPDDQNEKGYKECCCQVCQKTEQRCKQVFEQKVGIHLNKTYTH